MSSGGSEGDGGDYVEWLGEALRAVGGGRSAEGGGGGEGGRGLGTLLKRLENPNQGRPGGDNGRDPNQGRPGGDNGRGVKAVSGERWGQ